MNTSMLPVSGAEQLNTSEAQLIWPISSASSAYSRLVNPAPQNSSSSCSDGGMNMFQRPSAFALAFNSSITGMTFQRGSFCVLLVVDLHRRVLSIGKRPADVAHFRRAAGRRYDFPHGGY